MPATLFLCGDVMLGRGIDPLFVRRSLPALREQSIRDARDYLTLAEELHGAIQETGRPDVRLG